MEKQVFTEQEAIGYYDDSLDSSFDFFSIGGLHYSASQVFKAVDPIAYRLDFHSFVDSLVHDGILVEGFTDTKENRECVD